MTEGFGDQNQSRAGAFGLQLFATAAHEIKDPLSLIRQMALSLETGDVAPSRSREIAERIRLTSERSLRLAQALTLTHSVQEDTLFTLEPLDPVALCEEVARELRPFGAAYGTEVRVRQLRRPPLIVANRMLMQAILFQLADNALEYAEPGTPIELHTSSKRDGSAVRIGVRDYGPAVDTGIWHRLTDERGRSQHVVRRPETSGLGLYASRELAEAMSANIDVVRHRDGASFYIQIMGSTQLSLL